MALVKALAGPKGIALGHGDILDFKDYKEKQYEKLADTLAEYLDMEQVYGMLREAQIR